MHVRILQCCMNTCASINVQRHAAKLVLRLENYSYEDRLRIPNLPSLYYRLARGDMIETWKYLSGQYHS